MDGGRWTVGGGFWMVDGGWWTVDSFDVGVGVDVDVDVVVGVGVGVGVGVYVCVGVGVYVDVDVGVGVYACACVCAGVRVCVCAGAGAGTALSQLSLVMGTGSRRGGGRPVVFRPSFRCLLGPMRRSAVPTGQYPAGGILSCRRRRRAVLCRFGDAVASVAVLCLPSAAAVMVLLCRRAAVLLRWCLRWCPEWSGAAAADRTAADTGQLMMCRQLWPQDDYIYSIHTYIQCVHNTYSKVWSESQRRAMCTSVIAQPSTI